MAQQPWPHSLASLMAAPPLVVIGVLGLTSDPRPPIAPGSWETTGGSRIRLTEQLAEREIELGQRRDAQLLRKELIRGQMARHEPSRPPAPPCWTLVRCRLHGSFMRTVQAWLPAFA